MSKLGAILVGLRSAWSTKRSSRADTEFLWLGMIIMVPLLAKKGWAVLVVSLFPPLLRDCVEYAGGSTSCSRLLVWALLCAEERGRPFHLDVPPLYVLAVVLLILAPLFSLVFLDEFLGALPFVPVPLPLVDVTKVFMVGMEVLVSTRWLWRSERRCVVVSWWPRERGPNPPFVWRHVLMCCKLCLSAGLIDNIVLLPLLLTRMRLTCRSHSMWWWSNFSRDRRSKLLVPLILDGCHWYGHVNDVLHLEFCCVTAQFEVVCNGNILMWLCWPVGIWRNFYIHFYG